MKKLLLVIILLTTITAGYSQLVLNQIEMASDVPPTSIVMNEDFSKVSKIAIANIQSRTNSCIEFSLQNEAYVVTYTNSTYYVSFIELSNEDESLIQLLETYVPVDVLYESTRVGDVRDYLKEMLMLYYERQAESW